MGTAPSCCSWCAGRRVQSAPERGRARVFAGSPMQHARRHSNHGPVWMAAILAALWCVTAAADQVVDFDHEIDFSSIRTFALRNTTMGIARPEINNPLVLQKITDALRTTLTARGLKETSTGADVIVDWTVSGQRYAINEWGHAIPLDQVRGERRPPPGNPWSGLPESFVEGALVVDLTAPASNLLIWRGVYRNREKSSGVLAQQLPTYFKKLLSGYPPHKR